MSGLLQGVAGARSANYNASVADNAAIGVAQDTVGAEARVRSDARAAAGEAIAAQGASGLQLGTGSMLDVLRDNDTNAALDELNIRARGRNAINADKTQAAMYRAQGRNAFAAGLLGTGLTAATGGYSRIPNPVSAFTHRFDGVGGG